MYPSFAYYNVSAFLTVLGLVLGPYVLAIIVIHIRKPNFKLSNKNSSAPATSASGWVFQYESGRTEAAASFKATCKPTHTKPVILQADTISRDVEAIAREVGIKLAGYKRRQQTEETGPCLWKGTVNSKCLTTCKEHL